MDTNKCIDELLVRGLDDWIDAAEVSWVSRAVGGARGEQEIRNLALRIVEELLDQDLMAVGMVTETGFVPWTIPANEVLEKIKKEWSVLPEGPGLGEICWLTLTEKGARRAERA